MPFSDESYNLRVELDTKNCDVTEDQVAKLEAALDPLDKVVANFPRSDLYITITHHSRTPTYHVKTALILPKRRLFTGEREIDMLPAFERCMRKLVRKVRAYKARLQNLEEAAKQQEGTHYEMEPTRDPDAALLRSSVSDGDYTRFREAMDVYEEPLRKRIGRWVERYPEVEAYIDDAISIDDLVEEVFLNAFEQFEERSEAVALHDWLEHLIDPSLKKLVRNPDEELENIGFARTMRESGA